eukprot:9605831-Prorocentrum_lima.AAC.1
MLTIHSVQDALPLNKNLLPSSFDFVMIAWHPQEGRPVQKQKLEDLRHATDQPSTSAAIQPQMHKLSQFYTDVSLTV